jgi:GNAT superfamily N-acetyltransferase
MTRAHLRRLADHPDLMDDVNALAMLWEAFMREDDISGPIFGRLFTWFLDYQTALVDENGVVIGRALCAPIRWDGDDATLPDMGWNWALLNAVETYEAKATPNAISAIEITVRPAHRGQGLSTTLLNGMKERAREQGVHRMVAPVRPSLKNRYPITPIDDYVRWTKADTDAPFDPWLRVHWRAGAHIASVAHRSMRVTGSVADWEDWAEMRFPQSGAYVVPGALVPVEIDREADLGVYTEPNVWLVHTL